MVSGITHLKGIHPLVRKEVSRVLRTRTYQDGEEVFKQGDSTADEANKKMYEIISLLNNSYTIYTLVDSNSVPLHKTFFALKYTAPPPSFLAVHAIQVCSSTRFGTVL